MATNKRILRLTNQEAVVKFDGDTGSVTLDLDVDLKLPTETAVTPKVNILSMQVAGKPSSVASVSRNGVNLWDLQSGSAECIDLLAIGGASDTTENASDIVVTFTGAEGQLIMKLRKDSGYKTMLEPEQFGGYDDPTKVNE